MSRKKAVTKKASVPPVEPIVRPKVEKPKVEPRQIVILTDGRNIQVVKCECSPLEFKAITAQVQELLNKAE